MLAENCMFGAIFRSSWPNGAFLPRPSEPMTLNSTYAADYISRRTVPFSASLWQKHLTSHFFVQPRRYQGRLVWLVRMSGWRNCRRSLKHHPGCVSSIWIGLRIHCYSFCLVWQTCYCLETRIVYHRESFFHSGFR